MKIRKMLGFLLAVVIMLPMMISCSGGSDSDSSFFGSLPKVLEEYRAATDYEYLNHCYDVFRLS